MEMIEVDREHLHELGVTEEQIEAALERIERARAAVRRRVLLRSGEGAEKLSP